MRLVIGPRRCGKTIELVRLANAADCYIVTRSRKEAQRLSRDYGTERFPVTFDELRTKAYGPGVERVCIDGLDAFLRSAMPPVLAATFDDPPLIRRNWFGEWVVE